jgi:hypothetical protein
VTLLDAHLQPLTVDPVIVALVGESVLVLIAGLALRGLLKARSSHRPEPGPAHSAPPRASARIASAPPTLAVAPAALGAIGRLADVLDRSRRLIAAEERVARELASAGGWVVCRQQCVSTDPLSVVSAVEPVRRSAPHPNAEGEPTTRAQPCPLASWRFIRALCEHTFVTSDGSAYPTAPRHPGAQSGPHQGHGGRARHVGLPEALAILLVIAAKNDERFDAAAVRYLVPG